MPIWPFFFAFFILVTFYGIYRCHTYKEGESVRQEGWRMLAVIGIMVAWMSWDVGHRPPPPRCAAHAGQTVQWARRNGGKITTYDVYVTLPKDPNHYCVVESPELYNMGIGYTLSREYLGYLEDRP